jgi:hypothetical protein
MVPFVVAIIDAANHQHDNNNGDNYLIIVNDANLNKPVPQELVEKFDEEANKIWADKYGAALFFTVPEKLKVLLRCYLAVPL